LVADARSPIAQSWFEAVIDAGHAIQVLSTYPVSALKVPGRLVVLPTLPVAAGRMRPATAERARARTSEVPREHRRAPVATQPRNTSEVDLLRTAAYRETRLLAEMLFRRSTGHATQRALDDFRPDVVHALRIPYEAMLIVPTMRNRPEAFVVSTWGNDLTLWAAKSWAHRRLTRSVLRRTDCLHSDCDRDIGLAQQLGYTGPSVVAPGSGGIDVEKLLAAGSPLRARELLRAPKDAPIIFNPRSYRPYVRNDVFFAALPAVIQCFPTAIAVTVGMERNTYFQGYAAALGISDSVRFLPTQNRSGMADLFCAATVTVSPSTHDGTPNTLLEGMACGSFPIVGDLESVREWIKPGVNGLVVDPNDPEALSTAMINGLRDASLRDRAATRNRAIIETRASREATRPALERLYRLAERRPKRGAATKPDIQRR
jgi:glycosyltransferase involved in cell wall biosynthesis